MLYLNPNKEKVLTFEVELSGASPSEITGYVRFIVEGVEVGFPAHVSDGEIKAVITPLKSFLKKPLKNGSVFEAQLQLYTEDEEYFSPWKGEIEVKMPIRIEAKLTDQEVGGRKVDAKLKTIKENKRVQKPIKEVTKKRGWDKRKLQNLTENDIINYMKRAGTKNKTIQEIVLNEATAAAVEHGETGNLAVLKYVVKALKKPK